MEFEGEKKFLEDFGIWCKKFEPVMTDYNDCVAKVTKDDALADINTKLETYLTSKGKASSFAPYATVDE